MGERGVYTVTRGTTELEAEIRAELEERERIVKGLAKCPVCRGAAKAETFGRGGRGVWVGCDRSEECLGYLEIHAEGWSLAEAAGEWNRSNRGMNLIIRRLKRWMRERIGKVKRAERAAKRRKEAEEAAKRERIREIYGERKAKKGIFRVGNWRKGNK